MAVIQDLPPELLAHIIDLTFEPGLNATQEWTAKRFRRGLPRVARDWREPGERALYNVVSTGSYGQLEAILKCVQHRRDRTTNPLWIDDLRIFHIDAELIQRFLELGNLRIRKFTLRAIRDFPYHLLHLLDTKSIEFVASSSSALSQWKLDPRATLTHLDIDFSFDEERRPGEAAAVLHIVKISASSLTFLNLNLAWENGTNTPPDLVAALVEVAPRIRTLVLESGGYKLLPRILPSFTNLSRLEVELTNIRTLYSTLEAAGSQPVVLELKCQRMGVKGEDFLECMDLPMFGRLKRWRVWLAQPFSLHKRGGAKWAAKCKERGIEICNEKRLFTD